MGNGRLPEGVLLKDQARIALPDDSIEIGAAFQIGRPGFVPPLGGYTPGMLPDCG